MLNKHFFLALFFLCSLAGLAQAQNFTGPVTINQNKYLRLGYNIISSGSHSSNLAHYSNNAWYNGTSWKNYSSSKGSAVMQMVGQDFVWYKGTSGTSPSFTTQMVLKANGRLGLNVWSPGDYIHVNTTSGSMAGMIRFTTSNAQYGTYWRMGIERGNGHDPGQFMLYRKDNQGNTTIPLAVRVNGQVILGTNLKRVNTSDPAVQINGELCVTNTGACTPDYVFEDDYELRSIEELETFINENKHLPGVKSAGEIEDQGGVHMVEISYQILEKVEELTLYTIEQEKRIKELEEKLAAEDK